MFKFMSEDDNISTYNNKPEFLNRFSINLFIIFIEFIQNLHKYILNLAPKMLNKKNKKIKNHIDNYKS